MPRSSPTWQCGSRCATPPATHSRPAMGCTLDAFPCAFFFERTGASTPTSGWSSRARRARHPRELRWPVLCGWCGAYSEWWTGSGRALGSPRRSGFRTRAFASGSRLGLSPHAFASSLTAARGARRNRPVRPDPLVMIHEIVHVCNVRLPRGETRLVLPAPSAPALPLANWLEPTCDSPHSGHEGVQTPDRTQATDQL